MAASMGSMCRSCHKHFMKFSHFHQFKRLLIVNHQWKIDENEEESIENGSRKPSKHRGLTKIPRVTLPFRLLEAISIINERYPVENMETKVTDLTNYLWSRKLPIEDEHFRTIARKYELQIRKKDNVDISTMTFEAKQKYEKSLKQKITKKLKMELYHWKDIEFTAAMGQLYLNSRLVPEFSSLVKILNEISKLMPDFQPKTMLDFGSGLGSSIWASNDVWPNSLREHYCIDISNEMSTLAQLLLQGGDEEEEMIYPGIYFRKIFPFEPKAQYDIVFCAYSLFELPNLQDRLIVLKRLWEKTKGIMVIVENGTLAGHQAVLEARDLILGLQNEALPEQNECETFMPCPHDDMCPKLKETLRNPCNFLVDYLSLQNQLSQKEHAFCKFKYSYVVMRKGKIPDKSEENRWPRLIKQPLKRSKHVNCVMCTQSGNLQETVITQAKHGRTLYRCAKKSSLGDLLPVHPKEPDTF